MRFQYNQIFKRELHLHSCCLLSLFKPFTMKKCMLITAAFLFFISIQRDAHAAFHPNQKDTADNALTNTEKAQGWKLLFDGKTMNGWRTYQNKPQTSWFVNNGVLGCKYD